jgi:glutamate/tyrosine decarboxylase-like PLP-dependent enzyme
MAVLTAREWARDTLPSIAQPEILLPETAHPAFFKAAHYFNLKPVVYGIGPDLRADVAAARAAISDSTILLVGSAPAYPHGVVDPIADLARLARERGILLHVDSCVGGFMLPFVRRLGYFVPAFDFGVPGVTSISADLHKYGYAAKGASVILYRTAALRRYQLYANVDWPGGIYASPTMTGTRPGGAIAAAWAMLNHLGREGYEAVAARVMAAVIGIRAGIEEIDGIHVLGDPPMSILALASDGLDVYEIADELSLRGWHLDRQQRPPTLHMTVNHAHVGKEKLFLDALREAVTAVRRPDPRRAARRAVVSAARVATRALPAGLISKLTSQASGLVGADGLPQRSAPMYGMMGTLPNRGDLRELVLDLLEQFTTPQEATD